MASAAEHSGHVRVVPSLWWGPVMRGARWQPLTLTAGRDTWNEWGNPVTFARCVRYSRGAALAER
jgi:hypothetical protein